MKNQKKFQKIFFKPYFSRFTLVAGRPHNDKTLFTLFIIGNYCSLPLICIEWFLCTGVCHTIVQVDFFVVKNDLKVTPRYRRGWGRGKDITSNK